MTLPINYRKSAEAIINVDFFDFATGAGYKKFYLAGLKDSVGNKFILTTDSSLNGHSDNFNLRNDGATADFEITFNNPVTIANAETMLNYIVGMEGGNTGVCIITWVISHVKGVTVTPLGTVISSSNGNAGEHQQSIKVTLLEQFFAVGDVLRVTPTISYVPGGTGTGCEIELDPAGTVSHAVATTGQTGSSSSSINIPFKIDI